MLVRLLVVEELDWFYIMHSEAKTDRPEFMGADPASTENKKGDGWDIEEDGRDILSYPEDSNLWIHGHIERLNDFLGDLHSITSIITMDPKWKDIKDTMKDLWLGKMNWREFKGVDDQNPFNTLEGESLDQIGPQEFLPVQKWVSGEIQLCCATVAKVLKLEENTSKHTIIMYEIHLWILIDMGLNQLAVICGYNDWKEWKEQKEASIPGDDEDICIAMRAKVKVMLQRQGSSCLSEPWKAIGQGHWFLNKLIDVRSFRAHEDIVVCTASKEDIGKAVWGMTSEFPLCNLSAIFSAVYDKEP
ncbi:hypothetical protein BDR06DRAFT_966778 [Suillus hirtellus]|nr:hypothetical protein BDR06DRAFT_966778 [Suillus hirtellus]